MGKRTNRPPTVATDDEQLSLRIDGEKRLPPPRTEEEAEKRAVGLATNLALKRLQDGTASSQIIVHYLKIGSLKEQAELEKTMTEIELLKAKKKAVESGEEQEKKYQEVIKAIASYSGKDDEWEVVDDDWQG